VRLQWIRRLYMSGIAQKACVAAVICGSLLGCSAKDAFVFPAADAVDAIRNADLTARFPNASAGRPGAGRQASPPLLVPGDGATADPSGEQGDQGRVPATSPGAIATAAGVEFNFENADIQTVTKTLIGDILGLSFIVDPRVQGTITIGSVGGLARKDVLPMFENVLRMSNAAVLREGNLVKIIPIPEAAGAGRVTMGAAQPGFGVSVVPLRYTSAASVARMAENFVSRPGAIRADQARNFLLVQGTSAERQSALDVIATLDVEWLRNQSVGVYPLKSTTPETMIQELERIFATSEGGQGHEVIQFQPISRMNAVMVVAKSPNLLARVTQWVQRLDRSDTSGNALRIYRLKYGNAQQIAKILSDVFIGRLGSVGEMPATLIAPGSGVAQSQSRLDSLGNAQRGSPGGNGVASLGGRDDSTNVNGAANRGTGPAGAASQGFPGRQDAEADGPTGSLTGGSIGRGLFQNVRITADIANNSIVIYSNQEDFRIIEHALRDFDRPKLQVAIDATVAEVTLTDDLQYGVQHFFTSSDVGMAADKGSVGLMPPAGQASTVTTPVVTTTSSAAQTVAQTVQAAFLQRVLPGFNLLLGPEAQPRVILSALSTITDVKVLSSPSLVVIDNQPAVLEVGDQIPVTTSTATLLSNSNAPIVNTIEMRNTGVILKVLPHVYANGLVQLEIEQEISNVVNPNQQTLTPTISQRRIHSTVAVTSGQTVLLGGLISEQQDSTKSGIPGLNQIKYLGDLFGNTSKSRQRSEIIVFIRPMVVRNSVDAQAVTEEFRERLESMRGPRQFIDDKDPAPAPAPAQVIKRKY
jgi:general secretion pathway protein D